jgi:hypothetical protein
MILKLKFWFFEAGVELIFKAKNCVFLAIFWHFKNWQPNKMTGFLCNLGSKNKTLYLLRISEKNTSHANVN